MTEDNKSNAKQLEEKLRDTEENNEHLMDKLRSASVAYNDLKKAKSESEEETVKAKEELETLTSKIDNLEKELKEQQSKNELKDSYKILLILPMKSLKLEDELKSIKNPIKEISSQNSELIQNWRKLKKISKQKMKKLIN